MSDEREDWDALVKSPGWQRLLAYAKEQWGGAAYKSRVRQATTLEAVRAIDQVSDEVNNILTHPAMRIKQLDDAKQQPEPHPSRRGGL